MLRDLWFSFLIVLLHGMRGLAFGLFAFVVMFIFLNNTPHELALMTQSIDLRPAKINFLMGWGVVCLLGMLDLWVQDWKNNYWKIRY